MSDNLQAILAVALVALAIFAAPFVGIALGVILGLGIVWFLVREYLDFKREQSKDNKGDD